MEQFSFYLAPIKNLTPTHSLTLQELYHKLKNDTELEQITTRYRKEVPKDEQSEYKRSSFPYITVSGVFSKRNDKDIVSYSHLICIDCDSLTTEEFQTVKHFAANDVYTVLAFTSPSRRIQDNNTLIFNGAAFRCI